MYAFIFTAAIGAVIIVLGAINMTGNVRSLHSYHRNNVAPENLKPFGRLVGIGTIISGVACIILGALTYAATEFENELLSTVGTVAFTLLFAVGIAITFYAMKKYNGGIIR